MALLNLPADGETNWGGKLRAVIETVNEEAVTAEQRLDLHLLDPTPHAQYDDLPDLTLLFENGLI